MAGFFKPDELVKARQPLPTVARCGACGLLKTCQSPKMSVAGEGRRGILVVGEAPGKDEDAQGKPFVGASGRFLQDRLSRLGVKLFRDCWVTNALICRPPGNKIEDPRAVEYCRPNLIRSVQELRPTVVIVLGGTAVESLLGWLWKPDAGGISRWVGWRIPDQKINAWVCPNYHPSFVLREDAGKQAGLLREFFDHYLEAAVKQADSRPWVTPPRYADRVRVELDVSEAARAVRRITKAGRPAAFDFETTTLKPDSEKSRVVSCAIADSKGAIAFPWHDEAREASREFLHSTCPKVGWSAKFEDRWTRKEFGRPVRNWVWDGMLAAHVLDCREGITGLKFQAYAVLGEASYDDHIKPYLMSSGGGNALNRVAELDLSNLLRYNGADAVLEYEIGVRQAEQLGISLEG